MLHVASHANLPTTCHQTPRGLGVVLISLEIQAKGTHCVHFFTVAIDCGLI